MIELARYKALTPDSYGFLNYSLAEIFENCRVVETDPQRIWDTLKAVYGKTFFFLQMQEEYAQTFSENDKKQLDIEIATIKAEAEENVKSITEKCTFTNFDISKTIGENQIKLMRHQLNDKSIQINHIKAQFRIEIEQIKTTCLEQGYKDAEKLFQEREAIAFQKFDTEKVELYKDLKNAEELNQNFNQIIEQHLLKTYVICTFKLYLDDEMGLFDKNQKNKRNLHNRF